MCRKFYQQYANIMLSYLCAQYCLDNQRSKIHIFVIFTTAKRALSPVMPHPKFKK
jgi:hypothetical protein